MNRDIRCYIDSVAQVSCQIPLSDQWMKAPCRYESMFVRVREPDTKGYISSGEARRMSKILKRAVTTSLEAMRDSGLEMPDAIITGTGMGCMDNSEKFLIDMCKYGENCLKPTLFMQSTHNTISSQIAILMKCHGYNNTYSHKGISFESALYDAWLQIRTGGIKNALVGAHDEVTPLMSEVLRTTHPEYGMISEASVSAVMSGEVSGRNICEVEDIRVFHRPDMEEIASLVDKKPGCLMLGVNGNSINDGPYHELMRKLGGEKVVLRYRHLFGDNFSSPALAFYAAVVMLREGNVPEFMRIPLVLNSETEGSESPTQINILNHSGGTAWSLISLKKK